ncbi:MAG TPA: cache domain-containing protein [Vicinamibacterales bacterium]|nr:cache domain-containing protein [Acidobacteriota bacterium]HOC19625.1 cache domain-containing protein [Vicinamibacterales bacterium]
MSHLRINYRVFTVFLVVGLVMLATAAAVVVGAGQARLRASFGDHLADVASQTAASVDSYVYRRAIETTILASVSDVRREAAQASLAPLDAAAVREFDRVWQQSRTVPEPLAPITRNAASAFLAETGRNDQTYRELVLADRQGRLAAASGMTTDYFQGDEEWFTRAFGDGVHGRLNVGGVTWDESANTWALEISAPVEDPAGGQLAGVLKAVVDVREMAAAVSAMRLGDTGDAALVTDEGQIVLGSLQPDAETQFFAADLLRERIQGIARQESPPRISFGARAQDGRARLVGVGVTQLRASYPHLKWLVAVSQAESDLFAPVRFQLWSLLALLALMAIAVLGLALWFSLRLAAPPPDEELHLVRHAAVGTIDGEGV